MAFPAISCGIYGYPLDLAAPVALGAVRDWLSDHPRSGVKRITFVLRGDDTMRAPSSRRSADWRGKRR